VNHFEPHPLRSAWVQVRDVEGRKIDVEELEPSRTPNGDLAFSRQEGQLETLQQYAEYVDPHLLEPFREYDWSRSNNRDGQDSWDENVESVRTGGFREPAF